MSFLGVKMASARANAAHLVSQSKDFANSSDVSMERKDQKNIDGSVHQGNMMASQETMISPVGAPSFTEAAQMKSEVYQQMKNVIVEKFRAFG